jgi:serine/threonine-protein kinase SRK2
LLWLLCSALQRIMGVKYSFPANLHLSKECLDLISRIFMANPGQRIKISEIKSHPWFLKNLPEELKVQLLALTSAGEGGRTWRKPGQEGRA